MSPQDPSATRRKGGGAGAWSRAAWFSACAIAGVSLLGGSAGAPPCLKLQRAATAVSGDVRICPGRYRIADPREKGVIIIVSSGSRLDLTGVTLESGDSIPGSFVGIGVASQNVDSVTIRGGRIRGYRFGVRVEGGRGHRLSGLDVSGTRRQALRSTPTEFDEADWLDIFHPDTFERYGGGIYLRGAEGVLVSGVTAQGAQNGIGLFDTRLSTLSDNDVSGNSGWGIHLWKSSRNVIVRNQASRNVRCESSRYSRGCDSAALLLRERSDSNLIAENDLTYSGDGFFLSGQRPEVHASVGNLVYRNDASFAYHNAFEATFSQENAFIANRADSSDYGFWLGYSRHAVVRGNTIVGSRSAGIAVEHGGESEIASNTILGGRIGIHLSAPHREDAPSQVYRLDDNTIAKVGRGIVLEQTSLSEIRGNVLDSVDIGMDLDSAAADSRVVGNVFLRIGRWFIRAPSLEAGGNFWATPSQDSTAAKIQGRVALTPWRPATAAGY